MRHSKKLLALLLSSLALTACIDEPKTPTPDPVDPGTGQEFPETGYTKIGNDGIILEDQTQAWADDGTEAEGTQWSCVRDNDTGLYWEVKTNDDGLRDKYWLYTWYDTNPATNDGEAGIGDTGVSTTTGFENEEFNEEFNNSFLLRGSDYCLDSARCDTEKYIDDVNATQLCGFGDWRLPTADGDQDGVASAQELQGLLNCTYGVDCSSANAPLIDTNYFPNTQDRVYGDYGDPDYRDYWSSSPLVSESNIFAGVISFYAGVEGSYSKTGTLSIRLVRSSQSL